MGDTVLRLCLISVLLAGCGKVNNKAVDAAADTGPDADLSGDATIVTQAALFGAKTGDKVGSIDIVSHLPNNMILATGVTDANGNATIKVYPGGSVTAIYKHTADMGADLITWADVKPGDTLTFGSRQPSFSGTNNALGTPTYSWPALTGATSYQVLTSCGSTSPAAPATSINNLNEFPSCHRDPMDVVFRAFNGSALIGYNFRPNVVFNPTGTVSITSWNTTVPNVTINITGLPPEVSSFNGQFATIIDSDHALFSDFYSGTPTGGAFTKAAPFSATGERSLGQLSLSRTGFINAMQLFDSFSTNTLTQTVASPTFPMWVQNFAIASSALHKAEWFAVPEPSTTSTTTGELLNMQWSHQVSGVTQPFQWNVILPPGQTSFDFPPMPPALSDLQPPTTEFIGGFITVFEIPTIASYDMIRTLPSANIMCLTCSVQAGDLQRVVFTQSFIVD